MHLWSCDTIVLFMMLEATNGAIFQFAHSHLVSVIFPKSTNKSKSAEDVMTSW